MKLWIYVIIGLAVVVIAYLIIAAQAKKRQLELMALSQNSTNGVVTNAGGASHGNTVLDWVIALTPLAIAGGAIAGQVWGNSNTANQENQYGPH